MPHLAYNAPLEALVEKEIYAPSIFVGAIFLQIDTALLALYYNRFEHFGQFEFVLFAVALYIGIGIMKIDHCQYNHGKGSQQQSKTVQQTILPHIFVVPLESDDFITIKE